MPNDAFSSSNIYSLANQSYQNLVSAFPIWRDVFQSPKLKVERNEKQKIYNEVTAEEKSAIFEKLRLLFTQKTLLNDLEMRLYLEQQLSDITGLQITSEIDGYNLPHTLVKMQAGPHQLRNFGDQVNNHAKIKEALIEEKRSEFGWFGELIEEEKFGIGLPLFLLKKWQTKYKQTINWFKYRKILVINPWKNLMAVGNITAISPIYTQRFQAVANPELSRTIKLWFPNSQGKACLFLIENQKEANLGLLNN